MYEKLTYEEFRDLYFIQVSTDTYEMLQALHSIDGKKEVEAAIQHEYDEYLKTLEG